MKYFKQEGYADKAILKGPDGSRFAPFDAYKERLIRQKLVSIGSLNDYLGHVARFIEFVYVASIIGLDPTQQNLDFLISSYESYLLHGQNSDDELVRSIAYRTGRTKQCGPSSLPVIEAALTHFLRLSDSIASASGSDGLFSVYLPNIIVPISGRQAAKLRASTMLGGVIRGGANTKRQKNGLFRTTKRRRTNRSNSSQKQEDFAFPFERIQALLDSTNCYRDRAIYSLIAASGMRPVEVRQVRVEDIDIERRLVYAVSPFERSNPGITEEESKHLSWKGRVTSETFLIEPWASYFFDALNDYFRYEFNLNAGHPFVFQVLSGKNYGRPCFICDRSSRIKQFLKRAKNAGVELPDGVAEHSLRHAYGVYLLNYLPTPTGLGLSLLLVSTFMGHTDIKNTKIYARYDEDIVRAELEWANRIILGKGHLSKRQLLLEYYQNRISEITCND